MSQLKLESFAEYSVLRLKGQFIGGEETDDLRRVLSEAGDQQTTNLIIDLEKVAYLNSTALGVLISAHSSFIKRGGKIAICSLTDSIENIFVVTKLTLVFSIYSSVEEALSHLVSA